MKAKILLLLSVLALLCYASRRPSFHGPTALAGASATSLPASAFDSLSPASVPDSARADSAPAAVRAALGDSLLPLPDSLRTHSDSLRLPLDSLRAMVDTLAADSLLADSLTADSATEKSSGITDPIHYEAQDSLVYDAGTGLAWLYGSSKVDYQDMKLDAAQIAIDLDSSLVHAQGVADTAGVLDGKPVYVQGSDTYESEKMSFNFKTKKGYINNVATTQGNGYLQSEDSKRTSDGTLYLRHAKYTTCDAEHPHFYLALSSAKVYPGKEVIFGPAHLVVQDVPLPLAIPYGFFPFSKKYSSGIVMPKYGDETSRGFYLRDGGYYFALNDYFDLTLLGEIYTKGSWGVSAETNYNKRYRFSGNFYFSYLNTVVGERNMPDYSVTKSMKIQWTHRQDAKALPNSSFSARVNFASESYERNNLESMYNPLSYTQSTRASSVSYSRTFPNIGLTIAASGNLSQNMRDRSVAVTLPDLSISLSRFYPFKRRKAAGRERWYEKIAVSYTGQLTNSITTKESELFHSNLIRDWRNGMQHNIPISANFTILKYINLTPSFTFNDYMYTNKVMQSWDDERQQVKRDTVYGFYNLYDWRASLAANTTLYGFYTPSPKLFGGKIIAVRHVLKPSVSFNYSPDFTSSRYGYVDSYVRTDPDGTVSTVSYSPYQNAVFGYPSSTLSGSVTMSLSNNVEMKVRSDRDSTGERKISLIDELSGSLSYNFADKVRPWSDLNMNVRLKLSKSYTFSLNARFATYAYEFDEKGNVVTGNRTEWSYGRFGRFQGMSQNLSYTFNNETFRKLFSKKERQSDEEDEESTDAETDLEDANVDPDLRESQKGDTSKEAATVDDDGYLKFTMPWALTVSYGISMREDQSRKINPKRMRYPYSFTQSLNFSGYLRIAEGWNITFSSGYDFNYHELSMTTASLQRDLHCFSMSCSVVLRPYSSFNFTFQAKASELADALKWDKRSSYSSNIEWY